jgi:hypothetical protein
MARENYELDAVARQVAGKMQSTRIKAISRNRDCRMRVISQTSYVIECQETSWETAEVVTLPRTFSDHLNGVAGNSTPRKCCANCDADGVGSTRKSKRVVVNITVASVSTDVINHHSV